MKQLKPMTKAIALDLAKMTESGGDTFAFGNSLWAVERDEEGTLLISGEGDQAEFPGLTEEQMADEIYEFFKEVETLQFFNDLEAGLYDE